METDQKNSTYFNLLDEPWILVRNKHGGTEELSVLQVFRRAHELVCLDCELPIQNIAILRFLLAIVYAVFTRVDEHGESAPLVDFDVSEQRSEALRRWKALWDMPELPYTVIEQYLEFYRDRFWLKHPTQPFYQVAGLTTSDGSVRDISLLMLDVPSQDRRLFSLRFDSGPGVLTASEAARLLITFQAWDIAGLKSSIKDSLGNSGDRYPSGTGWLGKLGIVFINEAIFADTLLMNFVLLFEDERLLPFGIPIWEEPLKTALKLDLHPNGYIDLLTLQSRRMLLSFDDEAVTGYIYSYGDIVDSKNMIVEQMTAWYTKSISKTETVLLPSTHKIGRSIWRDLSSLLPLASDNSGNKKTAGIVNWLRILKDSRLFNNSTVNLSAVGVIYGTQNSVIEETIDDELMMNSGLFATLSQQWVTRIIDSLGKTEECINQLGFLARKIAQASGSSDGISEKDNARESAYDSFDNQFRRWLVSIDPEVDDMKERMLEWKSITQETVIRLGTELYMSTNSQAIVGRIDDKGLNTAAPFAFMQFRGAINTIMKNWKEDKNE